MDSDANLDTLSKIAIAGIFLAWFFIDTLVVTLGSLQYGVKFFDLAAVIFDRSSQTYLFGAVCFGCLLAPCLVYAKSSGEFFSVRSDSGGATGNFLRFANGLVHQGSGLVARHITVAAGGYLAAAASLVLAVQGVRRFRHAT
jgi:hypothetical protein